MAELLIHLCQVFDCFFCICIFVYVVNLNFVAIRKCILLDRSRYSFLIYSSGEVTSSLSLLFINQTTLIYNFRLFLVIFIFSVTIVNFLHGLLLFYQRLWRRKLQLFRKKTISIRKLRNKKQKIE